jgi:hypothetical protein
MARKNRSKASDAPLLAARLFSRVAMAPAYWPARYWVTPRVLR